MCALTASDDESDDDFPSVEELTRAALRPKISTELQVDQAQFGPDGYLGGSRGTCTACLLCSGALC